MQQHRRGNRLTQRRRDPDVVVVRMGAHDRADPAPVDHGEDRVHVVRRVDHHA